MPCDQDIHATQCAGERIFFIDAALNFRIALLVCLHRRCSTLMSKQHNQIDLVSQLVNPVLRDGLERRYF